MTERFESAKKAREQAERAVAAANRAVATMLIEAQRRRDAERQSC